MAYLYLALASSMPFFACCLRLSFYAYQVSYATGDVRQSKAHIRYGLYFGIIDGHYPSKFAAYTVDIGYAANDNDCRKGEGKTETTASRRPIFTSVNNRIASPL